MAVNALSNGGPVVGKSYVIFNVFYHIKPQRILFHYRR